jgi:hypothetical protein
MSRINLGIDPKNLTNEHLLAEHREIKRICDVYKKIKCSNRIVNIPDKFCLGKGHIMYFVYKPETTYYRFIQIHNECLNRNFIVEDYSKNWNVYNKVLDNDNIIENTKDGIELLKIRIKERLLNSNKKYWHYNKQKINAINACLLLEN